LKHKDYEKNNNNSLVKKTKNNTRGNINFKKLFKMKKYKNIFVGLFAVAIIAVAGYNVTLSNKSSKQAQLNLKNIELLAVAELTTTEVNTLHYLCLAASRTWQATLNDVKCPKLTWRTHKVCEGVNSSSCCDSSLQTDCDDPKIK
jgi:Na+-transporting NADH:ubiquinone oxidoreductase subunit NqrC